MTTTKNMGVILKNPNITVKNKEIAGTTTSHTKNNVNSANGQGQEKNPAGKLIVILGDNLVKYINDWDSAKKIIGNCKVKVYMETFSGAKTD